MTNKDKALKAALDALRTIASGRVKDMPITRPDRYAHAAIDRVMYFLHEDKDDSFTGQAPGN